MNERELRTFVVAAQIGRMDLVAKTLGCSQPAIGYQIRCLEETLGVKLFVRNSVGMRLTGEGQKLLPSARALLLLMENIQTSVDEPPGAISA